MHMNLSVHETLTGKTAEMFCLLLSVSTVATVAGHKNCWKLLRVLRSPGKRIFFKDSSTWFILKNELSRVSLLSAMQFALWLCAWKMVVL